jgi:predicted NAD/FAD-dependent oxidoreductase
MPRVAVIGAGMSGLACARSLVEAGYDVTIFEKSRGLGGRIATRRTTEGYAFDHGAQYFTVRDERFRCQVEVWRADALVAPWTGQICTLLGGQVTLKEESIERFVGVPTMNVVCKRLAADLRITLECQIASILREGEAWTIADSNARTLGSFNIVAISAPSHQTANLLAAVPAMSDRVLRAKMTPCWAVLAAFTKPLDLAFDGAFVHESPIAWASRNSSKPQRSASVDTWVLHASPDWSIEHLEATQDEVAAKLLLGFWHATGLTSVKPTYLAAHRWRYAQPLEPLPDKCLYDTDLRVGCCGDWCGGPRVEGAYLSGLALASAILGPQEK